LSSFPLVVIVGAARSGTTLLSDSLLAKIPDISYTGEIDFVWRRGAAFSDSDIRVSGKEAHRRDIQKWFLRFCQRHGGTLVLDKTPSNVLRIPWIKSVFPSAKIIHIIRDGRAVSVSAQKEWLGISKTAIDSQAFRQMNTRQKVRDVTARKLRLYDRVWCPGSLVEVFSDFSKAVRVYSRVVGAKPFGNWGPRTPGLAALRHSLPLLNVCALQWEFCVRLARFHGQSCASDYLEIHYENLTSDTAATLEKVSEFANVPIDMGLFRDLFVRSNVASWQAGLKEDELQQLEALIRPTLRQFGYC
jgi:hypothetical protein